MYVVEYVLGLAIVLVTIVSVLFILVLPRKAQGLEKLTLIVNKSVHYSFVALSRLARTYEGKDSILAPTAPVALMIVLRDISTIGMTNSRICKKVSYSTVFHG